MKNMIQRFIREEEGQDLIEYALLAALISIIAIAAITAIGTQVRGKLSTIGNALT
jgi:pilus assembly protein Flp/PilA